MHISLQLLLDIMRRLLSPTVFIYVAIPLGVMVVSWVAQTSFSLHLNSGGDIFAFALGLDLTLLLQQSTLTAKINPNFGPFYSQVFALALLVSIGFLIYATNVQAMIYKRRTRGYYPYLRVTLCWAGCIAVIGFHLYALLGS